MAGATGGVLGVQTPTALDVTTRYLVGAEHLTKSMGVQTPTFRLVLSYNKP